MTNSRGILPLATAALLLVAGTSCADDTNPTDPRSTPTASQPSVASSPSETQLASAAANALVEKYYATIDDLGQRPSEPLSRLSAVATSVQLAAQRKLVTAQRRKGERQIGNTKIARLEIQTVNLDNSDAKAGRVPAVQVDVCWDVSQVDVVDNDGDSIVSESRPDRGWTRLTVANYRYLTHPTNGWRVATGQDLRREPCAAAF